jgi:lipopolysaccharide transport system ATP-binding protein
MSLAIRFEQVSKRYRLGQVGTGTLAQDLERAWARWRGKPDPFASVVTDIERQISADQTGAADQVEDLDRAVDADHQHALWALREISFDVDNGEVLGIIGRNGAGKSTLLKLLSRVTAPTTGKIKINGRIASLLEVGTGFHPELTGRENIFLNGAILGMNRREIRQRLEQIIDFSGCRRHIDTPVKRYSSGMTVRLGFSIAAHLECEILVVDEVLAVGDLEFQRKCIGKMQELSGDRGRTVLFVSHNLSAVQRLCTKSLVLDRGRITFCGDTQAAIDHYSRDVEMSAAVDLSGCDQYGPAQFGRLRQCSVCDDNLRPTNLFRMGDTIRVLIDYECWQTLSDAEIGVKISTISGSPIHYFPTTWEGLQIDLSPGQHGFEVRIPNLSLLPGTYLIGAWALKSGGTSDHNVGSITAIEVIAADINGHHPDFARYATGSGESYAPCQWSRR